ncbi:hypothetical protein [Christiangramia flava]|uniref:hypothetical protein n=1 Tax=Christiangramia flava TaxID=1486245 RepID=UPI0009F89AE0|nr:hypothetical protein [Christiangramia flava]OSS38516.1 hypothetical protein C723_2499 [Christiangramia flava JLT2011]
MNNELPVSLLYISSADENNELVDKLQKDNVQYLQLSNSVEAIQFLQMNEVSAILIEHPVAPVSTEDTVSFIHQELSLGVPLYLYRFTGDEDRLPEQQGSFTLLDDDLQNTDFQELLKQLQQTSQPKDYSLNYLKKVSDNNQEFILQSLQIFVDSVKKNLDEAEKAFESGDFEKVGGIAHAIKPSYEMLENQEAPAICDALTYHRQQENIPFQLSELRRIYETITSQLGSHL